MIIFQTKLIQRQEHSSHSNNSVTYHWQRLLISEKHMCVSHKTISRNSFTFKWTWLSLQINFLQRKRTLFLVLSCLWHITNNGLFFQRKTCAFVTKAYHEIHTLLKECDYISKQISTEKRNTDLSFVKSLTYHNNVFSIQRNTCVSHKAFDEIHTL